MGRGFRRIEVATGFRWVEGTAYFSGSAGESGYQLLSDIPNNRIADFHEHTDAIMVFRRPVNLVNGSMCDRQGRSVTCEYSITRRVVRTEKDGKLTVNPNGLAFSPDGALATCASALRVAARCGKSDKILRDF